MSTNGRIGLVEGDKCSSIYTHWDSYPSHNGAILADFYDEGKLRALLTMGNVSSLGDNIGLPVEVGERKGPFKGSMKVEGECEFYYRDMNGVIAECMARVDNSFDQFIRTCRGCDAEYAYLMHNGVWYVWSCWENDNNEIELLTDVLDRLAAEKESEAALLPACHAAWNAGEGESGDGVSDV